MVKAQEAILKPQCKGAIGVPAPMTMATFPSAMADRKPYVTVEGSSGIDSPETRVARYLYGGRVLPPITQHSWERALSRRIIK